MPASSKTLSRVSDEAVQAKTGKNWQQWFRVLDREGARDLDHKGIVAIANRHGAGPWWAQMVTVCYEQERGKRVAHQKPAGFEISRSKTIAAPANEVFAAFEDKKRRARWLGSDAGYTIRKATPHKSLRITWIDGKTSVEVGLYAKGAKTQAAVQHSKLANAREAERRKAYWSDALDRLQALLED